MNIDDHVEACLHFFKHDAGILDEVLFIGAWARYFYRSLFKDSADYNARMATKDLDILLDRKKTRHKRTVDVHQKLVDSGYQPKYYRSKLIKYHQHELELEFLIPAIGSAREQAINVNAYNLVAQELAYLNMLWENPITLKYSNYTVRVPEPVTFAIHKLIIANRRTKPESAEQDRRDAEEVLYALRDDSTFEKRIRGVIKDLKKKPLKSVHGGIETFLLPDFRARLLQLLPIAK